MYPFQLSDRLAKYEDSEGKGLQTAASVALSEKNKKVKQ